MAKTEFAKNRRTSSGKILSHAEKVV